LDLTFACECAFGGIANVKSAPLSDASAGIVVVGRNEAKSKAVAFLCSKAVHPAMKHAGGGKVINFGLVPPSEVRDPRLASTLRELRKIGTLANDDSWCRSSI
jgi:hypothetical protein